MEVRNLNIKEVKAARLRREQSPLVDRRESKVDDRSSKILNISEVCLSNLKLYSYCHKCYLKYLFFKLLVINLDSEYVIMYT